MLESESHLFRYLNQIFFDLIRKPDGWWKKYSWGTDLSISFKLRYQNNFEIQSFPNFKILHLWNDNFHLENKISSLWWFLKIASLSNWATHFAEDASFAPTISGSNWRFFRALIVQNFKCYILMGSKNIDWSIITFIVLKIVSEVRKLNMDHVI